jgi:transmembrane sensor
MTEHDDRNPQVSVSEQAAEWFVRLRDRDLSAADRRKYVRWLKHSPSHISEFLRLCQLYGRIKRAKLPVRLPEELSNVVELLPRQREDVAAGQESRFERRPLRLTAVVCGLVLAATLGVVARVVFFNNTIETEPGEWRRFMLADGSVVRAGPRTVLQYDFDDARRSIRLYSGEAVFEVTKDPSRPFLVDAQVATARALGTPFGVLREEGNVKVTVLEGRVEVARGDQRKRLQNTVDADLSVALAANEQVSISDATPAMPLRKDKVDAGQALAWTQGLKITARGSAGELIKEFNRRNRVQILIDPALENWYVRGQFDASDPNSLVALLAGEPEIAAIREGPGVVRLVPEAYEPEDEDGEDAPSQGEPEAPTRKPPQTDPI